MDSKFDLKIRKVKGQLEQFFAEGSVAGGPEMLGVRSCEFEWWNIGETERGLWCCKNSTDMGVWAKLVGQFLELGRRTPTWLWKKMIRARDLAAAGTGFCRKCGQFQCAHIVTEAGIKNNRTFFRLGVRHAFRKKTGQGLRRRFQAGRLSTC